MKKIFTTMFFVLTAAAFMAVNAQQIPNNGFENWSGGKPVSWDAPNINLGLTTIFTVTEETTNPYAGSKSCKIETKANPLGGNLPGFITLGTFDLMTQTINGGMPFTLRPTKLKGYYKYTPGTGDQAFFGIGLSKWTGSTRDTIGEGFLLAPMPVATWTQFEVDINWTSTDNPDSVNIIIASSDLVGGNYVLGSVLWVDELVFEFGPVGYDANDLTVLPVQNYPNPFSNVTNIDFVSPVNAIYEFSVYDLVGAEVYKRSIEAVTGLNSFEFSAENLPVGMYMYKLQSGNIRQTKTMLINR